MIYIKQYFTMGVCLSENVPTVSMVQLWYALNTSMKVVVLIIIASCKLICDIKRSEENCSHLSRV